MLVIYHNPRCRVSRNVLQLIRDKSLDVKVIEYLKNVPTEVDLERLLMKLNMKPLDIVRKNDTIYRKKYKGKLFNDHEWIKIMVETPQLIERPIVVRDNKAVLCRPPEKVHEII